MTHGSDRSRENHPSPNRVNTPGALPGGRPHAHSLDDTAVSRLREKKVTDAERLSRSGDFVSAAVVLEEALRLAPENDHILNQLGDTYARLQKLGPAVRYWERASEVLVEGGFFLRAVSVLRKILRQTPDRLDLHFRIAELFFQGGKAMEAKSEYQSLGDRFIIENRFDQSIEVFRRLAAIDPGDVNAHIALAHLFVQTGRITEAADCYKEIGRKMTSRGDRPGAERIYRRALEIAPANEQLIEDLWKLFRETDRLAEMIPILTAAILQAPESHRITAALRQMYLELGRADLARSLTTRLAEIAPGTPEHDRARAEELLRDGEIDAAFSILDLLAREAAGRGQALAAVELLAPIFKYAPDHLPALHATIGHYRRAWETRFAADAPADAPARPKGAFDPETTFNVHGRAVREARKDPPFEHQPQVPLGAALPDPPLAANAGEEEIEIEFEGDETGARKCG